MALYKSPGGGGLLVGPNGHPTNDPFCCECGSVGGDCCGCPSTPDTGWLVFTQTGGTPSNVDGLELFVQSEEEAPSGCRDRWINYDPPDVNGCLYEVEVECANDGNAVLNFLGFACFNPDNSGQSSINGQITSCSPFTMEWDIECSDACANAQGATFHVVFTQAGTGVPPAAMLDPEPMTIGEQFPPEPITFEPPTPRAPLSEQVRSARKAQPVRKPRAARKVKQRPPEVGNWLRRVLSETAIKPKRGFGCQCNFRTLNEFDGDYWTRDGKRAFLTSQLTNHADRLKLAHTPEIIERVANIIIARARHVDRFKRRLTSR